MRRQLGARGCNCPGIELCPIVEVNLSSMSEDAYEATRSVSTIEEASLRLQPLLFLGEMFSYKLRVKMSVVLLSLLYN